MAGIAGLVLAAGQFGCSAVGIRTTPEPAFVATPAPDGFEIREYEPMIIAETEVSGDMDDAMNPAFRRLAGYIFGKNITRESIEMTAPVVMEQRSQKIEMTAPVVMEEQGDTTWMAFVMPEEWTMETLPIPVDKRVRLREVPARRMAVLQFTGFLNERRINAHAEKLMGWLDENGYETIGTWQAAGYDPPWTLPFLRRNEIMVELAPGVEINTDE
jgi:hypothetical protein